MTDRKLLNDVTRCDGRITTNPSGFGTVSVGQAECLRCLRRTAGNQVAATQPTCRNTASRHATSF